MTPHAFVKHVTHTAGKANQFRLTTIFWRPANLNLARLRASVACRHGLSVTIDGHQSCQLPRKQVNAGLTSRVQRQLADMTARTV